MSQMSPPGNRLRPHDRLIPPTEIGSFVAFGPDRSEFIGSASGVFFANTVFKAFADLVPAEPANEDDTSEKNPDPEPAHSYLAGSESATRQQAPTEGSCSGPGESQPGLTSQYPVLGMLPSPDVSEKLIMAYFKHWHPVFPFLHGPTFLEEVNKLYSTVEDTNETVYQPGTPHSTEQLRRMVTVQCVFAIAATTSGIRLGPAHSIQSSKGLTQLLGSLYCNHDILSLQALLAAELYLITVMSLRAASTVHGASTRIIYHAGLHRCPFRYVQLPAHARGIRKRIFWCAYVLDRHLGQALGHPLSFNDADIDVCYPGSVELHRPAPLPYSADKSQDGETQGVLAHLPMDDRSSTRGERASMSCTPASNHQTTSEVVADPLHGQDEQEQKASILGFIAAHAKLLGQILDLFHASITSRAVILERVQEITCQVHAWWNELPLSVQDEPVEGAGTDSFSPYHVFLTTLYNHSLLLLSRPFLSLPRENIDFKCSLQSAINASHCLLADAKRHLENGIFLSWPITLSAVWTAGLVISFSCLLGSYPYSKAKTELERCFVILDRMARKWSSARQCHTALQFLSQRLRAKYDAPVRYLEQGEVSGESSVPVVGEAGPNTNIDFTLSSNPRAAKRQRMDEPNAVVNRQPYSDMPRPVANRFPDLYYQPPQDSISVPQYIGPDFGFDASLPTEFEEGQDMMAEIFNIDFNGLFNTFG